MYKIIIYSNETKILKTLVNAFEEYLPRITDLHFKLLKFHSPLELIAFNENKGSGDIYFLYLSSKNIEHSLKIGKAVRKLNPFAFIIYISDISTYQLEYLNILPFAILSHPLAKEQLFLILTNIFKLLNNIDLNLIDIKTKEGTVTIERRLITFVEYENHYLLIHTKDGSIIKSLTIRISFKKWMEPLLKYDSFISPHKSYLVNMDYVKKITNNHTFVMQQQDIIPISSQSFKKIKANYLKYINDNYAITNIDKIHSHSY